MSDDDETLVEGEVIDAYFEDSDDPEAENGLAVVLRADIDDPKDLWGKHVVITVASRYPTQRVVHAHPVHPDDRTPCCGLLLSELPGPGALSTTDPPNVTCRGRAAS